MSILNVFYENVKYLKYFYNVYIYIFFKYSVKNEEDLLFKFGRC